MTAIAPEELRQPPAPVRSRMLPLDGLRGVAVLLVVVYHTQYAWALGGDMGVQVFFVLSGYLITTLLLKEHSRFGGIRLRDFYARRALRLIPALYLAIVPVLVVSYTGWGTTGRITPGEDLREMALVAATYFSDVAAAVGFQMGPLLHTWSLSVEEHYYLLWPPLFLLLVRVRVWLLIPAALLLTAVSAVWRWHVLESGLEAEGGVFTRALLDRARYGFDVRADALLIGCALAAALHLVPRSNRVAQRAAAWLGFAGLGLLLWSAAHYVNHADYYEDLSRWVYTAQAVAAAVLIWGLLPGGEPVLQRVFAFRPLVHVGTISYGLYLWNYVFIKLVGPVDVPFFDGRYSTLAFRVAGGFVMAELSYFLVERPLLRLKDRRFGRRE